MIAFYSLNLIIRTMQRFNHENWFNCINQNPEINSFINKNNENKVIISSINDIFNIFMDLHRLTNHITNVDLIYLRNKVRDLTNFDNLVVQYILNKKSKDQLATDIFKNDNLRKKSVELLNVYELLSVVSIERFNDINNTYLRLSKILLGKEVSRNNVIEMILPVIYFIDEFIKLLDISNRLLMQISYTYNLSVSVYSFEGAKFITRRHKFTMTEFKAEENKKRKLIGNNNHEASSSNDNQ
jgi:hypothetical protein